MNRSKVTGQHASSLSDLADEMVRLGESGSLVEPPSRRLPAFSLDEAYEVAQLVLEKRQQQGWQLVGRKIGFTNRTILAEYGVHEPIFGYMYDRTVRQIRTGDDAAPVSLARLAQPRLEPEIVFKFGSRVPSTHDPIGLLKETEWLAHGFELVQCHFPDWRFSAADTIADAGLHGLYIVGAPVTVEPAAAERLANQLQSFKITLLRNGTPAAEGGGEYVLGSPVNALAHLVSILETLPDHPPLAAGELVTTGTLTAAMPVSPGETWSTRIEGLDVPDLAIRFE